MIDSVNAAEQKQSQQDGRPRRVESLMTGYYQVRELQPRAAGKQPEGRFQHRR